MHKLRAIYCTPLHAAAILCVFAEVYSTEEGESSPESSPACVLAGEKVILIDLPWGKLEQYCLEPAKPSL